MLNYEEQYLSLLKECYTNGDLCHARNDYTYSLTNTCIRADCSDGKIPILTTKRVNYRAAIVELLWFLKGGDTTKYLHDHGVHIWDLWANDSGELGPIYGVQWQRQLDQILEAARDDPFSRRLLVNSWQLDSLQHMALVPCHYSWQIVNTRSRNYIQTLPNNGTRDEQVMLQAPRGSLHVNTDLVVNMRSSDAFIGMPFNLVNYGTLLHIICNEIGTTARNLYINSANFHIYGSHFSQVEKQLLRNYDKKIIPMPTLKCNFKNSYRDLSIEDFTVSNYVPQKAIKAPVLK